MKFYGNMNLAEGTEITNLTVDSGDVFPDNPNTGELFYHNTLGLSVYTNGAWQPIVLTNDQRVVDAVSRNGDTMLGSLGFPKTSGAGIKIENSFGWKDLIGDINPRAGGNLAPVLRVFNGNIREFAYNALDQGDCRYHIPHDYAPGTDLFIHVHWGHVGTDISGTFQVTFNLLYAKGHNQATFSQQISATLTVPSLNITNSPQFIHRVDEIQISTPGGSANLLDTSLIEVDGLLLVNYSVDTIPTITGGTSGSPFLFTIDVHYQSTNLTTKNKSPNFYE